MEHLTESQRQALERRNEALIAAVLRRAEQVCPGALALLGVYGSYCTGDMTPLSDLDLLIVPREGEEARAQRLSCCFIQDDLFVGHDLYCCSWQRLEEDAACRDGNLARLMDARIVYAADETSLQRLEALRAQVRAKLAAPFSAADWAAAEPVWQRARAACADVMTAASLRDARYAAAELLYETQNLLCLLHKTYFRRGVKHCFAELDAMAETPPDATAHMDAIARATTLEPLQTAATALLRSMRPLVERRRTAVQPAPETPAPEDLRGVYEECVSNWRGKLYEAAQTDNAYLALMSMASCQLMLDETPLPPVDMMSGYQPEDLSAAAVAFDRGLEPVLEAYTDVGLPVLRYPDVDAMIRDYVNHSAGGAPSAGDK